MTLERALYESEIVSEHDSGRANCTKWSDYKDKLTKRNSLWKEIFENNYSKEEVRNMFRVQLDRKCKVDKFRVKRKQKWR